MDSLNLKRNELESKAETLKLNASVAVEARKEMIRSFIEDAIANVNVDPSIEKTIVVDNTNPIDSNCSYTNDYPAYAIELYDSSLRKKIGIDIAFYNSNAMMFVRLAQSYDKLVIFSDEHDFCMMRCYLEMWQALIKKTNEFETLLNSKEFKMFDYSINEYLNAKKDLAQVDTQLFNNKINNVAASLIVGMKIKYKTPYNYSTTYTITKATKKRVSFDLIFPKCSCNRKTVNRIDVAKRIVDDERYSLLPD